MAGSGKKKVTPKAAKAAAGEIVDHVPAPVAATVIEPKGEKIVFRGVKTHNLRDIDVTIPKNKIVSVVGVS